VKRLVAFAVLAVMLIPSIARAEDTIPGLEIRTRGHCESTGPRYVRLVGKVRATVERLDVEVIEIHWFYSVRYVGLGVEEGEWFLLSWATQGQFAPAPPDKTSFWYEAAPRRPVQLRQFRLTARIVLIREDGRNLWVRERVGWFDDLTDDTADCVQV
jgi:hypothetical protein